MLQDRVSVCLCMFCCLFVFFLAEKKKSKLNVFVILRDGVRQSGQATHENDSKMGEIIFYLYQHAHGFFFFFLDRSSLPQASA